MTLIEYFAGQALAGELANSYEQPWSENSAVQLARRCLCFSKALMAELGNPTAEHYGAVPVQPPTAPVRNGPNFEDGVLWATAHKGRR